MSGNQLIVFLILLLATISSGEWGSVLRKRRSFPGQVLFTERRNSSPFGVFNRNQPTIRGFRPFPECILNSDLSLLIEAETLRELYDEKHNAEEEKLIPSTAFLHEFDSGDIMKFHDAQLRADGRNGPLLARAALKLSKEILNRLSCHTTAKDYFELNKFLQNIRLPPSLCAYHSRPNCGNAVVYRTISGVCNNLDSPYQGAARTAFGRLLPPAYEDGLHRPRSLSVLGGRLPGCREVSLALSSRPDFDTAINHHFVIYGQFIVHDITLATSTAQSGRTSRVRCPCESEDFDMCNIIPIPPNDPAMAGQGCINTTATSATFGNNQCTLGVKEQMNGNSHYIDLSPTYGSTDSVSKDLRIGTRGFMKFAQTTWSKFPIPPGQPNGGTCVDGSSSHQCFAGGDVRIMENLVLSSIQTEWLRAHNIYTEQLARVRPDWISNDELLYQEARKILSGLHQHYIYELWLPILIGESTAQRYLSHQGLFSRYEPETVGVVFNEVAGAVLRLHTFVRDTMTRCRPNGDLIDQVMLHDVVTKCRFAYDAEHNGVDSFMCGALHDFAYAGDHNYARQLHHHLFEHTTPTGQVVRNDIVSMNICRAREHGIQGYNAYRQFCGLPRAEQFEDFADTMNMESIQNLKNIYKHPDDVDLLLGVNHEDSLPGAVVGPVSACLLGLQFRHLKYGDRFFYTHEGQFTPNQLQSIQKYPFHCFICHTTDIEQVPLNPFRPPHETNNPMGFCSQCPEFDFNPWRA